MRERDRTLSIQKKKLLRTTTFSVALLVVATMILSSAAPAINVNMNTTKVNENTQTDTLGTVDYGTDKLDSGVTSDAQLASATLYKNMNGNQRIGNVVFDNGMYFASLASAQLDSVYGIDSTPADDFYFDNAGAGQCIDDVHWIGGHWNGAWDYEVGADWVITIFKDAEGAKKVGTTPGDVFAGPFTVHWADLIKTLIYDYGTTSYWNLGANIPHTCFPGCGEVFWISIYAVQDFPPQTGWGMGYWYDEVNDGHMAEFKCPYFGFEDWTDSLDVFGYAAEMCFQLTAKAAHDVAVTAINHPVTGDQLCPCLPVEVEVTNFGSSAETNVPVHVSIWSDIHALDYWEEFYWYGSGDWWIDSGGYFESIYPYYGYYMFTLFGGTYTISDIYYYQSINTATACNPVVEFYMWHDTYGSDDYIQVTADGNPVGPQFYRVSCPGCEVGWQKHQVSIPIGTTTFGFMGVEDGIAAAYPLYIDGISVKDIAYEQTVFVNLAVGETQTVTLPDFCPCQWHDAAFAGMDFTYNIEACTELATDEVPGNDCMTDTFTVHIPFEHDIGVEEKVETDLGCLDYNIKGVIRNYGQYEECCFKVYANVYEGYYEPDVPIMYESFNSPLSGLPAGWSTNKPSNVWIGSGSYGNPSVSDNVLVFYWYPYGVDQYKCTSPAIPLGSPSNVEISFKYCEKYAIYGPFTFAVETSNDGFTWTTAWQDVNPAATWTWKTVSFTTSVGSTFYMRFNFNGDIYNIDYLCVNDLNIIKKGGFVPTKTVLSQWFCVDTIDICENQTIDFGTVHFDITGDCGSKDYYVCIKSALCDPMDDNPLNDELCNVLTVNYEHNKAVEITKPETKGDVILFHQEPIPTTEFPSAYTSDTYGYTCYDDFEGVTAKIGAVYGYGLALICCWSPSDPADLQFDVGFYDYNGGSSPGALITMYDNIPTELVTYTDLGDSGYGFGSNYMWRIELPTQWTQPTGNGWLSINSNGGVYGATWFLWLMSHDGDNNAYQNTGSIGVSLAFTLVKTWPDIWMPMGEQEFCAKVTNIGTFDNMDDPTTICEYEGVFLNYTLWLVIPPECPDCQEIYQLMDDGSFKFELPCGEFKEECFTYDFTQCGAYELIWTADTPIDCDWSDNIATLSIGVDTCAPVVDHTTNPAAPNGCNNWYTSDVKVIITAEDGNCDCDCPISDLASIHYKLNGGDEIVKEGKNKIDFMITKEGINLVEYWAVDVAGNVGAHKTFEIALDKSKPYVDLIYEKIEDGTLQVKFTAAASDLISGVQKVEFYIDTELKDTLTAPPYTYTVTWDASYKTKTFKAKVYDGACLTAEDTVFGGDIDTVRALYDAIAQSHPLAQTNIR